MLLLPAALLAGCGRNPVAVVPAPALAQPSAWIGSYAGGSRHGDVVLDLRPSGTALAGEIVFGWQSARRYRLTGSSRADSIFLQLAPGQAPDARDFTVRGCVIAGGGVSARMVGVRDSLDAALACRPLPRDEVAAESRVELPLTVIALAWDGNHVWVSTAGDDYLLMEPGGRYDGTATVYHDYPLHWTSSALTFDGTHLWGAYPVGIASPGGNLSVADLLAFDASGRAPDSLRLDHRPAGLAYDGTWFWSLHGNPQSLIRFDRAGIVSDSLHVGIPDAYDLAWDGAHFWTLGWYLERLYELDARGQVLAMWSLPLEVPTAFVSGLALEGTHVWFAETTMGASTLHRMTLR